MFIIIKLEWPNRFLQNVPSSSRNDVVQDEEHQANNKDHVNDPMEENDNNNIVQDDGTNQLIQDLFAYLDEDGDRIDGICDEPLVEKIDKQLYSGSRENILSATLLLVNLNILNHLSNNCMTQILRYVIYFITYT